MRSVSKTFPIVLYTRREYVQSPARYLHTDSAINDIAPAVAEKGEG
jgi:hypothetical protein